eukprot:565254-Prymnesium_polylepis.1
MSHSSSHCDNRSTAHSARAILLAFACSSRATASQHRSRVARQHSFRRASQADEQQQQARRSRDAHATQG